MLQEDVVGFTEPLELCSGGLIAWVFVGMRTKGQLRCRNGLGQQTSRIYGGRTYLFVCAFDDLERCVLRNCVSAAVSKLMASTYIVETEDAVGLDDLGARDGHS